MKCFLSGIRVVPAVVAGFLLSVWVEVPAVAQPAGAVGAPTYRGIYLDEFTTILGNSPREDSVLQWCVGNGFNAISLYDLHKVMVRKTGQDSLARFIRKARVDYGISQVAAVRGISRDFVQMVQYDSSRTEPMERFTAYNLENEWWNNGSECNFDCYARILELMQQKARRGSPPRIREAYIGWFINPARQEAKQAGTLVRMLDRILVHAYRKVPEFEYLRERFTYLGKEAQKQNRTLDVIVLFSAEPEFMADYYQVKGKNRTFEEAYRDMVSQFEKADFEGKRNIRLIGYQLFAYSFARTARPRIVAR